MTKVSIIISTYNRPEQLKRAIESVLAQTFKDWELIIVDDASTDIAVSKTIFSFSDHNPVIQYRSLLTHFGSDTRPKNTGIKHAKGEYIAFLDDDNTWRPDHLAALVKALTAHPEVDLVYGDRWAIDEDEPGSPGRLGPARDFDPYWLLQKSNYIDTSDVLVRGQALRYVGGFDESQRKYIDWNLWVRLAKAGSNFLRVPLVLTDYRLHSGSKSKTVHTKAEEQIHKETGQWVVAPDWHAVDCDIHLPYLGEVKKPRVAIFSLTYDRLEYTKACFESLYKTAGYEFDHIIVDNGSTDGTVAWLKDRFGAELKSGQVRLYEKAENEGISRGSNTALDALALGGYRWTDDPNGPLTSTNQGRFDIIGKVDNDCLFLNQGWLARIVDLWGANHRLALSPYVQGLKDSPGGHPRSNYGMVKGELLGMTTHLGGICHFVDARAYRDFRWDEDMPLHGVQDLELSQYLKTHGYQMAYLENWFIEHYKTTAGQEADYPEYFERRKREKTERYTKKD